MIIKKAKLPMLPLTNGVESTKLNIFIYSLLMVPVIIFPYLIDFVGLAFLIPINWCLLFTIIIYVTSYLIQKDRFNPKIAKNIFGYSILYLFLIFVLFLIDKIVWLHPIKKTKKKKHYYSISNYCIYDFSFLFHFI